MVGEGQLYSKHANDLIKMCSKDIFGDYFYGIAIDFMASGQFQEMGLLVNDPQN